MAKETNITTTDDVFMAEMQDIMTEFGGGAVDSLTTADVVMPRYKLIQNTSRKGTPGMWVSTTALEEELEALNIVILDISSYRVMFPEQGQGDRPLCRSNDGYSKSDVNGVGDGSCESCRYSVWSKDPNTGRNIKPRCASGYTLLGVILLPDGSQTPGMVSLKGAAIKPLKQYFTRMKTRNIPSFAYITTIKAEPKVNDLGRFFVPEFEFGETLSLEAVRDMALQARSFKQYISADIMADVEIESPAPAAHSGADAFTSRLDDVVNDGDNDEIPF